MLFKLKPPPNQVLYQAVDCQLSFRRSRVEDTQELIEALRESLDALRGYMPWAHFEHAVSQKDQSNRLKELDIAWRELRDFGYMICQPTAAGGERIVGCLGMHLRCLSNHGVELL